ncbi:hypothetical protein HDF13_003238 [Edaphobacter lichenicola]|uniref:Uncharacterized protein n=1 Tax=Tunturiibacter gelidiferens TaxID=3069689 RepID=A0ACC5P235_9BACT|nr:hypothetical protein [Edaphobacter lichenicola]
MKRLVETSSDNEVTQAALTRGAVALLYAHWEGLVKRLTETYLSFVGLQRLKNSELSDCMLALIIRSRFQEAESAQKLGPHLRILEFFRTSMDHRSRLPNKGAFRTESNLSSKVLEEILITVGIDSASYELKFHMIDHGLLAKRNHIAHGQLLDVDEEDYLYLHDEVSSLLTLYRNDLENAAVTRQFQKDPVAQI